MLPIKKTLATCQQLVQHLNRDRRRWMQPELVGLAYIDARALPTSPGMLLDIRVVHSTQEPALQALLLHTSAPSEAAFVESNMRFAIAHATSSVPHERRSRITLAINALDATPQMLEPIIAALCDGLRDWVADLGFASAWLVGDARAVPLDHGSA